MEKSCDSKSGTCKINKTDTSTVENKSAMSDSMATVHTDKPAIPFWSDDPNVIFQKEYLLEFFPTEHMTYEQKMNAISRLVILLTIIGFILTKSIPLLIISVITMTAIFLLYGFQKKENSKNETKRVTLEKQAENFEGLVDPSDPVSAALQQQNIQITTDVFDKPTSKNPFSNVLMTDYEFNPDKKPAPPSFNANVNNDIVNQAKNLIQEQNPYDPSIADKLFKGTGDSLVFEQSLRQFTSNPSTTIPNDQKAFADFCFGTAISAKESNIFALSRNLARHQNI